ncbi:MAG TPA: hypothetical protein VH208_08960 [Myxococcaceae bacterium]|nr:hypothetical protein [Myxococcaceae bacterium]
MRWLLQGPLQRVRFQPAGLRGVRAWLPVEWRRQEGELQGQLSRVDAR